MANMTGDATNLVHAVSEFSVRPLLEVLEYSIISIPSLDNLLCISLSNCPSHPVRPVLR